MRTLHHGGRETSLLIAAGDGLAFQEFKYCFEMTGEKCAFGTRFHAEGGKRILVVAAPDAEQQTPLRNIVEHGDLLRSGQGSSQRQQVRCCRKRDAARHGSRCAQNHQRVGERQGTLKVVFRQPE